MIPQALRAETVPTSLSPQYPIHAKFLGGKVQHLHALAQERWKRSGGAAHGPRYGRRPAGGPPVSIKRFTMHSHFTPPVSKSSATSQHLESSKPQNFKTSGSKSISNDLLVLRMDPGMAAGLVGGHPSGWLRRAAHKCFLQPRTHAVLRLMDVLRRVRDDIADINGFESFAHLQLYRSAAGAYEGCRLGRLVGVSVGASVGIG